MVNINKILFITLSNIGDVILTLPALDILRQEFPVAKITVMSGPRPKEIFENSPGIDRHIVYDKQSPLKEKIKLFNNFRKEKFDMVIDFRNSLFGALLPAKYRTSPFLSIPKSIKHMKQKNLYRLQEATRGLKRLEEVANRNSLWINKQDQDYVGGVLRDNGIKEKDDITIIASGARSYIKRWAKDEYAWLCARLLEDRGVKIILVGDNFDNETASYISDKCGNKTINLCGKTKISQLAALLMKARLLITNDSAIMHMGSYLNIPTLALFGPTDELRYGPWAKVSSVVKKDIFCRPCAKAHCSFGNLNCMRLIKAEDVLKEARNILVLKPPRHKAAKNGNDFQRILIVRTDRIGDVLLSTPAIKVMRDNYPNAYIAIIVSPYAKEIVEGNPYLDKVIVYDKDFLHKTLAQTIRFIRSIKKLKFDLALALHPANRVHLITFLAGIKKRIGYNYKLGFLLTDRIKHDKQLGLKHETEYALDLVRYLGIKPKEVNVFMPINQESENWADELFKAQGLKSSDKLLGIHPAASCPSKIWPAQRFAQVVDRLIVKYGFKVLIFSGPNDIELANTVANLMKNKAVNFAGKTSLSQLASLLKRCKLFISNDSGPVHISSAVGTAVISIFGRGQKGLGPQRWGPIGAKDKFLHKDAGCIECLAHKCKKQFACLKAITVEDVLTLADVILKQ